MHRESSNQGKTARPSPAAATVARSPLPRRTQTTGHRASMACRRLPIRTLFHVQDPSRAVLHIKDRGLLLEGHSFRLVRSRCTEPVPSAALAMARSSAPTATCDRRAELHE